MITPIQRPATVPAARRAPVPAGGAATPMAGDGWFGGRYWHLLGWAARWQAPAPPAPRPGGWVDDFRSLDAGRWRPSGVWANGSIFDAGWRPENVVVHGGQLALRITAVPTAGTPHAAGEIATREPIRHGRVEARLKAAKGDGVITSVFTYTGPSEGRPHDEIDIEFLGNDTRKVQLGYFTNGKHYATELVDLGFDAAAGYHTYAFEWGPAGITWFVDGKQVKHADGREGPLPTQPQRVFANVWPTKGADGWAGRFKGASTPIEARYDWIAVTPRA